MFGGRYIVIGPFLIISTIVMTLLMFMVALLALVLAARKRNPINKSMCSLTLLFFAYFLFAFFHYYFQQINVSVPSIKLLGCFSDLCFCMMVICWLDVIMNFAGRKPLVDKRIITIITLIYIFIVETIVLIKAEYHLDTDISYIPDAGWRYTVIGLNSLFAAAVISIAAIYLVKSIKNHEKGYMRNGSLFFSVMLIVYMLWISLFDYESVSQAGKSLISGVIMDPVLIAYCIIDIVIILFFFRKDPLELFLDRSEVQKEEKLAEFVKEEGLTKREAEVLELICGGMNNPEIAETLFIAENTVKRHINNIFQKSGVKNRYELITKVFGK
ncbi:MAG: LuxR C-terminal-related transcriptional regulator [Anaerovoracaceae bacterium]